MKRVPPGGAAEGGAGGIYPGGAPGQGGVGGGPGGGVVAVGEGAARPPGKTPEIRGRRFPIVSTRSSARRISPLPSSGAEAVSGGWAAAPGALRPPMRRPRGRYRGLPVTGTGMSLARANSSK